jgi:hypothetical protein
MTVFGPHCPHDDCGWAVCDIAPEPESGVWYTCRHVAECDLCGPTSPDWPRLAAQWVDWCAERYGSASSEDLRARGAMPPNVVAMAELVEAHPVVTR